MNYYFEVGDKNIIISRLKEFFNTRAYLKTKNDKTNVYNEQLETTIAEYQVYHKLTLQGGVLNEEVYSQIGKEMMDYQIDLMSINHPDLRKLLYGVGFEKPCEFWDAVAPVIAKESFIGWGHAGVKENCFDYCWRQLKEVGHDLKSPGWGTAVKMNPHIYQIFLTKNVAGMKEGTQPQQFTQGVLYLKKALQSKTPVMVGVDDDDGSVNKDKVTDHYVVIVGMGSDSRGKYFLFYDNALNPDIGEQRDIATSLENRLYCDCDNFIIKGEGDKRNKYIQGNTQYKSYTVTQIRESK